MRRDAILLATTVDGAGVPTAVQGFGNATVLARLLDQLSGLGVEDVTVITRPGGLRAVTEAVSGHAGVDVLAADDLAGDLLVVADAVAAGTRPLTLVAADLVTHREALAGLLADPRIASGALTTADPAAGSSSATATAVRVVQGRVVSGGSPFHRVGGHRHQHPAQPFQHQLDAGRVEHVGAEFGEYADPGGATVAGPAFAHRECQIHSGRVRVDRDLRDLQIS